jgi:two-component system response regulator AtoC
VDVRIIAATNQKLHEMISQGKFRKDLYYRLNIISIEVPPLRDRKADISLLVEDFIKKHSRHTHKKVEKISDEALSIFLNYNWPGNIRELENVIERATILSQCPVINPEDLPESLGSPLEKEDASNGNGLKLKQALKDPERDLILKALDSVSWKRNDAADMLGINRTTLFKKMKQFGLLKNNCERK